jgi:hypothetical protein
MQIRSGSREEFGRSRVGPLAGLLAAAAPVVGCSDVPYPFNGPSQDEKEKVVLPPPEPPSLVIDQLSVGMPTFPLKDGRFSYRVKFFVTFRDEADREGTVEASTTITR